MNLTTKTRPWPWL